jgi:ferredoxin-like protein FixX
MCSTRIFTVRWSDMLNFLKIDVTRGRLRMATCLIFVARAKMKYLGSHLVKVAEHSIRTQLLVKYDEERTSANASKSTVHLFANESTADAKVNANIYIYTCPLSLLRTYNQLRRTYCLVCSVCKIRIIQSP